jgi:general secretion pathway protein F
MPKFRYKAVKDSGEIVVDTLEAVSRAAAIETIRAGDLFPISVTTDRWFNPRLDWRRSGGRKKPLASKDLLEFTRELATLLRSSIQLDRALRMIAEMTEEASRKNFVQSLHAAVRKGSSLADAMAAQAGVPPYCAGLIKAGESNGNLSEALDRLVKHLEQSAKLADDLRSALYYPVFVILVSVATMVMMLLVVVPEFKSLFDSGTAPPLELQILFGASELISNWGWLLLLAVALLVVAARGFGLSRAQREIWDRMIRRIPIVGGLVDRVEGARFCRTLGTLHASGMPMLQGLSIAAAAISNRDIAQRVDLVIPRVRRGEGLSASIQQAAVLSRLGDQMLRIGEESGQLESMLLRLADIYDDEVRLRLARLEAILVPAVTIAIGLFVGGIVTIMLTAILSSYDLATT